MWGTIIPKVNNIIKTACNFTALHTTLHCPLGIHSDLKSTPKSREQGEFGGISLTAHCANLGVRTVYALIGLASNAMKPWGDTDRVPRLLLKLTYSKSKTLKSLISTVTHGYLG